MLKTILKIAALSVATLTLLSACGVANKLEDAADRAQDAADNAADRAENERERLARLTPPPTPAKSVVSQRIQGTYSNAGTFIGKNEQDVDQAEFERRQLDDSFNLTASKTQDTFALRQNVDNLIMTVNGTNYTFTPDEVIAPPESVVPASYSWSPVGGVGRLFEILSLNNNTYEDLRDVIDGTHPEFQGTVVLYTTLDNNIGAKSSIDINLDYISGYATVGIQTLPSVVASQTATATYTGNVYLDVSNTNIVKQTGVAIAESLGGSGKLTMTVDFDRNTISGTGTDSAGVSGTLTFGSAPIVGNGFTGTFTMDSEFRGNLGLTNNPTGNYSGHFFGPAADDLAGVMRFDGTSSQGALLGHGGFRGDKQ